MRAEHCGYGFIRVELCKCEFIQELSFVNVSFFNGLSFANVNFYQVLAL